MKKNEKAIMSALKIIFCSTILVAPIYYSKVISHGSYFINEKAYINLFDLIISGNSVIKIKDDVTFYFNTTNSFNIIVILLSLSSLITVKKNRGLSIILFIVLIFTYFVQNHTSMAISEIAQMQGYVGGTNISWFILVQLVAYIFLIMYSIIKEEIRK